MATKIKLTRMQAICDELLKAMSEVTQREAGDLDSQAYELLERASKLRGVYRDMVQEYVKAVRAEHGLEDGPPAAARTVREDDVTFLVFDDD